MLLLLACKSSLVDSTGWTPSDDSVVETADTHLETGDTDTAQWTGAPGFGWSLAWHEGKVWVGSPYAQRVAALGGEERTGGKSFGWALASDGSTLWASTPLEEDLDGAAMAGAEGHVAWTRKLAVVADGVEQPHDQQPSALAWDGDELLVSYSRGALILGGLERAEGDGDAGYSLCVGDFVALGAPSLNQVWLQGDEGWEVIQGSGRFGHALSCRRGEVLVGAPVEGAVWLLRPGQEPELLAEGDELGASVLITPDGELYAGAPGNTSSAAGSVLRLR